MTAKIRVFNLQMERTEIKKASVLVLCNYFAYDDNIYRAGSEQDYTEAIALFKDKFKFENFLEKLLYDSDLVFDDRNKSFEVQDVDTLQYSSWTHTQMKQIITHWIKQDKQFDAFILIISSHGTNYSQKSVVFGENRLHLSVEDILDCIERNSTPAARQTPKFIFLQACRGKKCTENAFIKIINDSDNVETTDPTTMMSAQQEANTIAKQLTEHAIISVHANTTFEENPNAVLESGDTLAELQLDEQALSTNNPQHTLPSTEQQTAPMSQPVHPVINPSTSLLLPAPSVKLDEPLKLPNETLVMFATTFDHVASRDTIYGSPMLTLLYKFLDEWKQVTKIHNINIMKVLTKVVGKYGKDDGDLEDIYAAVLQHNLTKTPFL